MESSFDIYLTNLMLGVGDLKIFCFELTHDEYWAIATRFEKYTLGRLRNTFYKVDPLWVHIGQLLQDLPTLTTIPRECSQRAI